ncbi:MAG: hypothetical protein JO199_08410 [Candidatus Eremiobacteraeota bacterium]|nr:hypothetical protein [Candidatus Eremiobacteraeota bacterium]
MKRNAICALLTAAILAGCGSGVEPGASAVQLPKASAPQPGKHGIGRAVIKIRVPACHKRDRCRSRGHFISPATQSVAIAVDTYPAVTYNLTPTSAGCSVYGPQSYLECKVSIEAPVGPHVFSIVTYDGLNGTGQALSSAIGIPYTVVSGSNQGLGVVLGGLAASVAVIPPQTPQVTGSQSSGFTIYGNATQRFTVLPVDVDGNYIIGPGAPTAKIQIPKTFPLSVGASPPNAPNVVPLRSTYQSGSPISTASLKTFVTVTPYKNSGGTLVFSPVSFLLYQPWVYVSNQGSSTVGVTDERGNPKTLPGSPFSHVPDPSGITYDPHNQWPYIPSFDDNVVCVYDVLGNLITVPGNWQTLYAPYDLTYVNTPTNGDVIYVVNNNWYPYRSGNAPPRNKRPRTQTAGMAAGVTGYDENGNAITTLGAFNGLYSPVSIAYDSHNGYLYVPDNEYSYVFVYDLLGNKVNTLYSVGTTSYGGITFDSHNNLLYVVDATNHGVIAFTETGVAQTLPAGAFGGLTQPWAIRYDPYNGLIYVGDQSNNTIYAYDEKGQLQNPTAGFTSGGTTPWGIAVVP